MIPYRYTLISKEGWLPIAVLLATAIVLQVEWGWGYSLGAWILTVCFLFLYRDPPRKVPASPLGIVAPVDGVVVALREGSCPYLKRETIAIGIKSSITGVYTVRSAIEGKIMEQWFGPALNASELLSDQDQQKPHFAQWIKTDEDDDVVMVLKPTFRITKFHCYVRCGERIGQGQRCTFVLFGANTDVFIPIKSHLEVKPGDVLRAGETIIATLIH